MVATYCAWYSRGPVLLATLRSVLERRRQCPPCVIAFRTIVLCSERGAETPGRVPVTDTRLAILTIVALALFTVVSSYGDVTREYRFD